VGTVTVAVATGASGAESIGVDCPGTARALGGGGSTTDTSPGFGVLRSVPLENNSTTDVAEAGDAPTGWLLEYEAISFGDTVSVYAICA
jgi:hypothetical protein